MQSRAGSVYLCVCVCLLPFSLGLPPIQHHQITSNPVPCVIGSVDKQRLPEEALMAVLIYDGVFATLERRAGGGSAYLN